jgi:hypothetical protein
MDQAGYHCLISIDALLQANCVCVQAHKNHQKEDPALAKQDVTASSQFNA